MNTLLVRDEQGKAVAQLRAKLAQILGTDAEQYPGLGKGDVFDAQTEAAVRHWQSGIGIIADGVIGPYCQSLLGLLSLKGLGPEFTVSVVQHLFPTTKPSNIQRYLPYVCAALEVAGIKDRPMILAALGTIRALSEGFVPIAEFPSHYNTTPGMPAFSAYEGRQDLGNTLSGDGALYRGRGFVQLLGRSNYKAWSTRIGLDLESLPDLANAPEVAALLLALTLADGAAKMRPALTANKFKAASKLVNNDAHGLDRFIKVFTVADQVLAPVAARKAGGTAKTQAAKLDATKDPADLRDRLYLPKPLSLPDLYPTNEDIGQYLSAYTKAGLILDQGAEGACTGFGLACVINYLRWRKSGLAPELDSVSPRMLYNFARRYDEYAGEDYDGSSCRGALRGWYHHGVCLEADWPYVNQNNQPPKFGYATRAAANTLGVYYRIDLKAICDLQAAIFEVGAIYVSAFTHDGWNQVATKATKLKDHSALPAIPFDGKPSQSGGHAFALVGFNTDGFVIQNSWGKEWGGGGFALLSYADWLANGMDAWVAALGVSGVVLGQMAAGSKVGTARSTINRALWWDEATAYEHSVVMGNDGRVTRYLTQDELSRALLFQACGLPDQWFRTQKDGPKRLVIYAHGGLNDEAAAIQRARAMGRYFIANGCYPLFMIWKTGALESIGDIFADRFRTEPPRAGGIREALTDASDLLIEKSIGRPLARPIWSEMKENAEFASLPTRGGDLLVTALQNLALTWGEELEIHLVGHSAGSIFLGYLIDLLAARKLEERVASIHLYAPACTVQFANRHYAPHENLMKRLYLDILSDTNERDDNVAQIYRKSLLYLVSNALEGDLRTPILGMDNVNKPNYTGWDGSSSTGEALGNWRQALEKAGLKEGKQITTLTDNKVVTCVAPNVTIDASHGSFDNNIEVLNRTLVTITGGALTTPVDDLRDF